MNDTQERIKGRAYIQVSHRVAPEGIGVPRVGEAVADWWVKSEEDLLKTWQTFLLLPEGYTVVAVYFQMLYQLWAIVVESDSIAYPEDGFMIPQLDMTYQRTDDGKVSLGNLRVIER